MVVHAYLPPALRCEDACHLAIIEGSMHILFWLVQGLMSVQPIFRGSPSLSCIL